MIGLNNGGSLSLFPLNYAAVYAISRIQVGEFKL